MQTVCANCYAPLSHKQQQTRCMLCIRCESDWVNGHMRARASSKWTPLPAWKPTREHMNSAVEEESAVS